MRLHKKFITLSGLILVAAAGCKSTGESSMENEEATAASGTPETHDASDPNSQTYGAGVGGDLDAATLEGGGAAAGSPGQTELLSQRSIYFALDSETISVEYQQVIEAHARHLSGNPGIQVTLEGHADERGTREYNLALGERRAQSVKNLMTLVGVPARQIRTASYGEERPYATGHDDQSWSLNRRVDLVY